MDRFDFEGKKALVTGASSGVGRQVAILLSQMGAKVMILARREEELKTTLAMMSGTGHHYRVIDLADFDKTIATIKSLVALDGVKFDSIAHCAAIAVPVPLRSVSEENVSRTFNINFYSFAAILKCVASKRIFNNAGAVVGVSSCAAPYGQAGNSVYGASKGAMNAMMKSAAKELRTRGIRINTICPWGIKTEMIANQVFTNIEGETLDSLPDYLMTPEGVATVIVAFLSDSMKYVSGVALDVEGTKTWEE